MKVTPKTDITALDLVLEKHAGMSKQKAKKFIKYASFFIDGEEIKTIPSTVFKADKEIKIVANSTTANQPSHPDKNNKVVIKYEDEHMIIAVKPVGLLSCKTGTQEGIAFDNILKDYLAKRDGEKAWLWIAHRIDREVEGLLIFAKSEEVQQKLKDNWVELTKKYLALTEGKPKSDSGIIESWLKEGFKYKMKVLKKEVEGAKFAKTEYKFMEQRGKYSLLEIKLHTGRKNQIRAHLASIDCPIVGDYKYGADSSVKRQIRLVAYFLEFKHPITGKEIKLKYMPKEKFYKPSQSKDEKYK